MPLSVIRRFVYDLAAEELWVEFVSGRRYVYSGVPGEIADTFRAAFAKGIYFNSRIRDRFPCRQVVHDDQASEG